jgi:hypothetical protein
MDHRFSFEAQACAKMTAPPPLLGPFLFLPEKAVQERIGLLAPLYKGLEPLLEGTPVEEDPPATGEAAQPDVRPQAYHPPLVAAAGMDLPQLDDVAEAKLHYHG